MALEKINLEKWMFALGEDMDCLAKGREVKIPHTWNIEDGTEDYWGTGWYSYYFIPEESWRGKRVQVLFRSVYHDAYVYLNGKEICVHKNSGYTPFTAELTEALAFGEENQLVVKADNRFSDQMLPCERSFDWANDGGMIRPALMMVTGDSLIRDIQVTARPVITVRDERQNGGSAVFGVQACVDGWKDGLAAEWSLYQGCDGDLELIHEGNAQIQQGLTRASVGDCAEDLAEDCAENLADNSAKGRLEIAGTVLNSVRYWHFDNPNLYTLEIRLSCGGILQDRQTVVFGFRDFHVQGRRFYLNGEPVRIAGTEWMPGSDPSYGMAEPKEQLEKMLLCLKESNSILTRFHWQQDDWVYDWCDRHGMLVQEEVPFWGCNPPKAGEHQWQIFKQQIGEMVRAHRNHPSIIAWGVGNELDAQCEETIRYIKDAVAYTHRLDPERVADYVSNSIFKNHSLDGTTDGDIMMINDYIGTWHGDLDQYGEWDGITAENPDKPMVPSEFGLCEPAFSGGDERRNKIFLEKLECYRHYPNIAGTIYFCLNDYRTQMGEDGQGKLRKRVHGSTGLCGEPKPSYYTVQREYAPVILESKDGALVVRCRVDLPCYAVKGYSLKVGAETIQIPDLRPGESCAVSGDGGPVLVSGADVGAIEIYRPNGDRVL